MNFNPTVDLGDVIVVASIIGWAVKYYADMQVVKFKVETLWEWFDKHYSDFPPRSQRNPRGD